MSEEALQKQQIIQCLKKLGKELEAIQIQQPLRILMIGGAYMVTQIGNREITSDVDVLAYIDRGTEDYTKLLTAASFVAIDMHLSNRWLSDGIGNLLQSVGQVPSGKLWLKHGLLETYIPEPQYILALKLLAGGRDKDIDDIEVLFQILGIKKREQAEDLLKKYFSKQALEAYAPEIDQVLNAFFG
jgi:hypothetical protein